MKPPRQSFWLIFLVFTLLTIYVSHISAQEIPIGHTFSSDTIFQPFSGNQAVYSIRVNGSIQLYSDSSLVRVVLVDSYGNHFLIYESYPLITDTNTFTINSGCDETCFMDGIIPDSLRVDIISGFCTIDNLKLEPEYISNVKELQEQAKWTNDSVKIATMNHRIQEEHMYWRAGRNELIMWPFQEKEARFGIKHRLYGYDYYKGGIYQSPNLQVQAYSPSILPDQFNWQDRHDSNLESSSYFDGDDNETLDQRSGWLTEAKSQDPCQSCYAFSTVALVESYANLFFNNNTGNPIAGVGHHIDLDLSELEAMRCVPSPVSCTTGSIPHKVLEYIKTNYISEEDCFSYNSQIYPPSSDPLCNQAKCTDPDERIKISNYKYLLLKEEEYIKEILVKYGPISLYVKDYYATGSYPDHVLLLVGYKVTKVGDTVYHGSGPNDPSIILDANCSYIGGTDWFFKDSGVGEFKHHGLNLNKIYNQESHYLIGDVDRPDVITEIKCSDEDGDGYYWWGIHWKYENSQIVQVDPEDCNCPPSVKAEFEDCNDDDITAGPYATPEYNPENQPYYSCVPNNCTTSEIPYIINPEGEWWTIGEGDRYMDSTVIIPQGTMLTINCQVFFTPGAKIVVQPGGKLILEGTVANPARLTSGCGQPWGGIEIWGDPTLPQNEANQGKVETKYGIIENAECGIRTAKMGYAPDYAGFMEPEPYYGTGGIIKATFSVFRNNRVDVKIYPYRDIKKPNNCWFAGCRFETTESMLETVNPYYHLMANGINELNIKGCTFIDERDVSTIPRGSGIYSYNSKMNLVTLDTTIYQTQITRDDTLAGLQFGFYGMKSWQGIALLNITHAKILDNIKGVYLSGYSDFGSSPIYLINNTFILNNEYSEDALYCLYLNNCSGYHICENFFSSSSLTGSAEKFGVIVNNSGPENNYIYNNNFERLTYGIQGFNINRNSDAAIEGGVPIYIPTGLRFICNKMQDVANPTTSVGCNTDFLINQNQTNWISLPGIAYNQRNAANSTNPTQEPAGNVFSFSHTNHSDNLYDIEISTSVGKILYTHHTSSYPQTNLRLKPDDVSNTDWVLYNPRPDVGNYVESESCRDDFYPEGTRTELRSTLSQVNHKVDSLITLIRLFVDDGSTDTLKTTVDNSSPQQSYDVYQDLLSASPYLSDSVVKSSIEKEDVLPNAMIRDILVANPQSAKSEDLLNLLDQRAEPMPDSMWVEILQGKDTVGVMEQLIDELSGWIQRRDLYFQALADFFENDTANSWACDSLVSLCLSDTWLSSRYLLVNYYLDMFDYSSANNILHNIPYDFNLTEQQFETYSKMIDLVSILPQLYDDTSGYIVPDSSQSVILEDLATLDYDIPGAWARNILIASGLMAYDEPVFSGSTLKSSRKDKYHWTRSHSIESVFKVFPNPASDFIIVEYKNNYDNNEGLIRILDLDGRLLKSQLLKKKENQQIIPVTDLIAGTYIVQFVSNGSSKGSQKVVIIR